MSFQRPKGTNDILPGESEKWQFVEETARLLFRDYQYNEMRTPIFEHYEVISRSVGDTTDIVSKEMYDFYDKGERHVTLRPEGTVRPRVCETVQNFLYGTNVSLRTPSKRTVTSIPSNRSRSIWIRKPCN